MGDEAVDHKMDLYLKGHSEGIMYLKEKFIFWMCKQMGVKELCPYTDYSNHPPSSIWYPSFMSSTMSSFNYMDFMLVNDFNRWPITISKLEEHHTQGLFLYTSVRIYHLSPMRTTCRLVKMRIWSHVEPITECVRKIVSYEVFDALLSDLFHDWHILILTNHVWC